MILTGEIDMNATTPRPTRWPLIAGLALLSFGTLVLMRVLRRAAPTVVPELPLPIQTPTAKEALQSLPQPMPESPFMRDVRLAQEQIRRFFAFPAVRWPLFVLVSIGLGWLLLNIKPPYSTILLAAAAVGGIVTRPVVIRGVQRVFDHPLVRWLAQFRVALAYVLTVSAITLVAAGAYALEPTASVPLLREGMILLGLGGLLLGVAVILAARTPHVPMLPVPSAEKLMYRIPFSGRAILIGVSLLGLLALTRVIQTPLPFETNPNQDDLFVAVIIAFKTYSFMATISPDVQFVLLLVGGLVLVWGLGARRLGWLHGSLFLFGLLILTLLAEVNGKIFIPATLDPVSTNVQFWMLAFGVSLVVIGLGQIGWPRLAQLNRRTVWLVGGLTALALGLRLLHLETSARFFVDELSFALGLQWTWVRPNLEILAPMESVAAFPNLFTYWQSQGVMLFGRTFFGLRVMSALLGALGVPALYLLARSLFDKWVALIAALLLATFPPHLHFSRLAISEIAGPLFGTLSLAFLARGLIDNRRGDYALGGAMLGMTHYFHEGSRVIYTPLAVLWVVAIVIIWRPRVQIAHLLLAGVTAVIVALPIYYTLVGMNRPMAARMVDNNSALDMVYWRALLNSGDFQRHIQDHVIPPFLIYVHLVENTFFYRGKTALLLTTVAPAFVLGLFYTVWRWRSPGMLLAALWWMAVTAGNTLMVDSAGSPRYVMVFPVLMLLAAVGLRYTLALMWPDAVNPTENQSDTSRYTAVTLFKQLGGQTVVLALLAIGLAVIQTHYYFNIHLPIYNQQFRDSWGHRDAHDALLRSLDFPTDTQIHIISDEYAPDEFYMRGVLQYMANGYLLDTMTNEEFTVEYAEELPKDVDHAFFVDPRMEPVLNLLRLNFGTLPMPLESPFDTPPEKQFLLYFFPRSAEMDSQPSAS